MKSFSLWLSGLVLFAACNGTSVPKTQKDLSYPDVYTPKDGVKEKAESFAVVKLMADVSGLDPAYRKILPLMIEAAQIMDDIFWQQAWGEKEELLKRIQDENLRKFVRIHYGPWDRLDDNLSFVNEVKEKPAGANFYPPDMTEEEYNNFNNPAKDSPYTLLRRDSKGKLLVIPYHEAFAAPLKKAAALLEEAAALAPDEGLKKYLQLRAKALLTDTFTASDVAWMEMKTSPLDLVIGPIENYEDQLFGKKTAYEAYVLIKDMEWSKRLEKYASFLPELQKNLPVKPAYKTEMPGSNSDLNAYDIVYYAGDCNAGGKTIAVNLPNDEAFQLQYGTRRLQLKNAIRAKFDKIMQPIAGLLISPEQQQHVKFDAFFANTMFHEVAHGLGIKNTINGKGTVSEALGKYAGYIEEGKADILGLYMITRLHEKAEVSGNLMDYYVTFLAGIFRSIRFGAASDHGRANMVRFNYFSEKGAFTRKEDGTYLVDEEKMKQAISGLSDLLLTIQGDGNKQEAEKLLDEKGIVPDGLQKDLGKLKEAKIPIDIVFEQGVELLQGS